MSRSKYHCALASLHRSCIDTGSSRASLGAAFGLLSQCRCDLAIWHLSHPNPKGPPRSSCKLHLDSPENMAYSTDFNIPLNIITKIIAETVTDNISVQEDYVKALSRATSLFILYSTTKANEVAAENNRRTIHSQDVLDAIAALGFEQLVPDLISWHSTFIDEKENAQKTKKKKPVNEEPAAKQSEGNSAAANSD